MSTRVRPAIFINGVQVASINFDGDPANWQAFALVSTDTENAPQEAVAPNVNLPANVPVEIGVTVRSNSATSSDIGFDLEVYSTDPEFGQDLAADGQLMAYPHAGFWQCMDTLRDKRLLNSLWDSGRAPWKFWTS